MAVTHYKSTDASAPVLTNVAGTLITVLDAILVNGYGAKAAAGWGKEFTGTNKAVYRPPTGNRHRLRVEDTGVSAVIRAYESMTGIDTGTVPMPVSADLSFGKATTSLPTPWACVADDRTFYFFSRNGSVANSYKGLMFGDFYSYLAADTAKTYLHADPTGTASSVGDWPSGYADEMFPANAARFVMRNYLLASGAITVGWNAAPHIVSGAVVSGYNFATTLSGTIPYPAPTDGKLWVVPILIHETAQPLVRGKMRGLWRVLHPATAFADGDEFAGSGDLAGKTFRILRDLGNHLPQALLALEISNTWPSSA